MHWGTHNWFHFPSIKFMTEPRSKEGERSQLYLLSSQLWNNKSYSNMKVYICHLCLQHSHHITVSRKNDTGAGYTGFTRTRNPPVLVGSLATKTKQDCMFSTLLCNTKIIVQTKNWLWYPTDTTVIPPRTVPPTALKSTPGISYLMNICSIPHSVGIRKRDTEEEKWRQIWVRTKEVQKLFFLKTLPINSFQIKQPFWFHHSEVCRCPSG